MWASSSLLNANFYCSQLKLALACFTVCEVFNCYKCIKTDKAEQDWSSNQFAVNASEFSA